jgi:putative transport protein
MLALFAILALGSWLGQLSFKGISLGTAGVLFVALVFGHFGVKIPKEVTELGLILFVYAVGLQAGPRFFRTFQRHGLRYVAIALAIVGTGALATIGLALALRLPYTLAAGMYTGALTCTPALAAAVDAVERIAPGGSTLVPAGYGIAYPFSMIGLVVLMQVLPRLLGRDVKIEETRWKEEKQVDEPELQARRFRITNANLDGKRVSEVNPHRLAQANISRVKRGERVFAATPDIQLHIGDVVMVVGPHDELERMPLLLGEETDDRMDVNTDVLSVDVDVTEPSLTGRNLAKMKVWERYTVVITRIRRQGLEMVPTGTTTLELGDHLRVVGERASVEHFVALIHGSPQRADETSLTPFLIGLFLGVLLGAIPFNLPGGMTVQLGSAGGAFLVSLLMGHFGRIGRLRLYVPPAARIFSRELGLMLFLAGAGTTAGASFFQVLLQQGPALFLGGALITVLSVGAGLLVMDRFFKMNLLASMGGLTAGLTNPPGLAAANAQTETDLPTISYASIYPVALIFKIVLAQLLVEVLLRMGL